MESHNFTSPGRFRGQRKTIDRGFSVSHGCLTQTVAFWLLWHPFDHDYRMLKVTTSFNGIEWREELGLGRF
jgi:hypothetical protein